MPLKSKFVGVAMMAGAIIATALGTDAAALAQEHLPTLVIAAPFELSEQPSIEQLPDGDGDEAEAGSLPELVAQQSQPDTMSEQMRCLAGAVYFEAKGETLPGQLAVARVVINRAASGRFPDSYCGVVFQRSQFSFVQGRHMPAIRTASAAWRRAVAVAQIAVADAWKSPTEGALYFHAARVAPGWKLTRIARVDDHVFYR